MSCFMRTEGRRTDGWTNRHDEANSRFSQFFESAKKGMQCHYTACLFWRFQVRWLKHPYPGKTVSMSIKYCECLYSYLSGMQRACAVLYCNLWAIGLCKTFLNCPVKILISGKLLTQKVFWFSLKISCKMFLILRNIMTNVHVSLCKAPLMLVTLQ